MKFLSLYTPNATGQAPDMARYQKMGELVQELTANGKLVATGGVTARETGGFAVSMKEGAFSIDEKPTAAWMRAGGYAILEAPSREAVVEDVKRFLSVAGDGVSEVIQLT